MTDSAPDLPRTVVRVPDDVLLAEVVRGDHVESTHVGAVAVEFADGRSWSAGDVRLPVWMRSAVKPFQALPLLERGIASRLGLGRRELALISASHDGTDAHVAVVDGILRRAGLSATALGCGPHAPFDQRSRLALARSGTEPLRLHNNCSGKHAGFLLLAQDLGAPLDRYLDPDSPGQRLVRDAVAEMAGLDAASIELAVDGCGAPTLRMPLDSLARAFCRLVNPGAATDVRARSCRLLFEAITAEPVLLSGERRICAALIRSAQGRIYPKNGAEGVYALGVAGSDGSGFGLAVKVRDGAERGYWPVVVRALIALGLWDEVPGTLADFAAVPIMNTQRRRVGTIRCVLEFPRSW